MRCAISVIVPIYNAERYLGRCIESIRRQAFRDMEIILVDDGSTDRSGQICCSYAAADARVRAVHKQNGGLVSARQAGVMAANGKYIAFVDADDWIEQDMYQSLYTEAERNNADIVLEGMVEDVCGSLKKVGNMVPSGVYASDEERMYICRNMLSCEEFFCMGVQPYLWNKLFRRELVLGHMPSINTDIRVGEDAVAVYPMLAMAGRLAVLDGCHYHYCIRGDSMTGGIGSAESEYENAAAVNRALKEAFGRIGVAPYMEKQLERYAANNVLTRAYGVAAGRNPSMALPPFDNVRRGDSIIIYGAGAFGKAVWRHASESGTLHVKAWLDSDAGKYKGLGLPVRGLDEVRISPNDVIAIAVFREKSMEAIKKGLLDKGVEGGQIRWIGKALAI